MYEWDLNIVSKGLLYTSWGIKSKANVLIKYSRASWVVYVQKEGELDQIITAGSVFQSFFLFQPAQVQVLENKNISALQKVYTSACKRWKKINRPIRNSEPKTGFWH